RVLLGRVRIPLTTGVAAWKGAAPVAVPDPASGWDEGNPSTGDRRTRHQNSSRVSAHYSRALFRLFLPPRPPLPPLGAITCGHGRRPRCQLRPVLMEEDCTRVC
ncbi:unnamed protein product, partial [Ectocarpus sp. 6 AP-2014]